MKIAILGGSFDPPHIGHILIAQQVIELLKMDEVWLMPNFKHSFSKMQTPVEKRLHMVRFLKDRKIKISDLEIKRGGISYTIDTLKECISKFPNHEFFWILGSDQLESFQKYYRWKEIVKNYNVIIFPRESMIWEIEERVKRGFNLKKINKNIIILAEQNLILTNVSSTKIRERVKNHQSIKYMVPGKVEKYITDNKLYE